MVPLLHKEGIGIRGGSARREADLPFPLLDIGGEDAWFGCCSDLGWKHSRVARFARFPSFTMRGFLQGVVVLDVKLTSPSPS
jgi:hypothetical protein